MGQDGDVPDDFLIARNPDSASTLPYLVRIPLGEQGIVLKSKDTWPRTSKVYCHRAGAWPDDADVVERIATRVCVRRGAAIELVLDRTRESRSQFVLTYVKGREAIFWQSARTTKQARPGVRLPKARAAGAIAPGEEPARSRSSSTHASVMPGDSPTSRSPSASSGSTPATTRSSWTGRSLPPSSGRASRT